MRRLAKKYSQLKRSHPSLVLFLIVGTPIFLLGALAFNSDVMDIACQSIPLLPFCGTGVVSTDSPPHGSVTQILPYGQTVYPATDSGTYREYLLDFKLSFDDPNSDLVYVHASFHLSGDYYGKWILAEDGDYYLIREFITNPYDIYYPLMYEGITFDEPIYSESYELAYSGISLWEYYRFQSSEYINTYPDFFGIDLAITVTARDAGGREFTQTSYYNDVSFVLPQGDMPILSLRVYDDVPVGVTLPTPTVPPPEIDPLGTETYETTTKERTEDDGTLGDGFIYQPEEVVPFGLYGFLAIPIVIYIRRRKKNDQNNST